MQVAADFLAVFLV